MPGDEVLKHLTHLPELKGDWRDSQKLKVIEKVYQQHCHPGAASSNSNGAAENHGGSADY